MEHGARLEGRSLIWLSVWTAVFGVTMGFFEAAVVVYLNRLQALGELAFSPQGRPGVLLVTEVLREAASLGMICAVACLSARGLVPRLAQAGIIFGLWDVFYYVFLRLLIGFPATPLTWDVLFLIPRPWLGPVLAPVLVSAALVACGFHALWAERCGREIRPAAWHWVLGLAGGLVVVLSFTIGTPADFTGTNFPSRFRWEVFLPGLTAGLAAYLAATRRGAARPAAPQRRASDLG